MYGMTLSPAELPAGPSGFLNPVRSWGLVFTTGPLVSSDRDWTSEGRRKTYSVMRNTGVGKSKFILICLYLLIKVRIHLDFWEKF